MRAYTEVKDTADSIIVDDPNALLHCSAEKLEYLEQIQSFSYLLEIKTENNTLLRWSENLSEFVGHQLVTGIPIDNFWPELASVICRYNLNIDEPTNLGEVSGIDRVNQISDKIEVIAHTCLDLNDHKVLIIECIPFSSRSLCTYKTPSVLMNELTKCISSFKSVDSISDLLQSAVEAVQKFTGYLRVMLYQFDDSWNGAVVAESTAEGVQKRFFNQHFPASDIPTQARELYLKNPIRVIADVAAEPIPLMPKGEKATDLTFAISRQPSAFHVKYLLNMNVRATLTISIIMDGKLWGILACHHDEPKSPPHYVRIETLSAMNVLGAFLSDRIYIQSKVEELRQRQQFDKQIFTLHMELMTNVETDFWNKIVKLVKSSLNAQHFSFMLNDTIYGDVLPIDVAKKLSFYFEKDNYYFKTNKLTETDGVSNWAKENDLRGLLIYGLDSNSASGLLIGKTQKIKEVEWAGLPTAFTKVIDSEGNETLGARRSFEIWKQVVEDESEQWPTNTEYYLDSIVKILLQKTTNDKFEKTEQVNQLLSHAINEISDAVIITDAYKDGVTEDRRIVFANPAAYRLTGYQENELIGKSPSMFQGEKTDKSAVLRISNALNEFKSVSETLINYTKNKKEYITELKIVPFEDINHQRYFVSVQRDVTKKIRLHNELTKKTKLLEDFSQRLPGAIYKLKRDIDHNFYYEFVSAGFKKLYGIKSSEKVTIGLVHSKIYPDDLSEIIRLKEISAKYLRPHSYKFRILQEDDTEKYLEAYSIPYIDYDKSIAWYGFIVDTTEKNEIDIQLSKQRRVLEDMLRVFPERLLDLSHVGVINHVYTVENTLFGVDKIDIEGKCIFDFLPVKVHEAFIQFNVEKSNYQDLHIDFWLMEGDKKRFYHAIFVKQSLNANVPGNYLCVLFDITNQKENENRIQKLSVTDGLTGLINRRGLQSYLNKIEKLNFLQNIGVLFIDIDGFKSINDIHGHHIGDLFIEAYAKRLSGLTSDNCIISRVGGDEFIIIIILDDKVVGVEETLFSFSSDIQKKMNAPLKIDKNEFTKTCSIGVAYTSNIAIDLQNLVKNASVAMNKGREVGPSNVTVFNQALEKQLYRKFTLEEGLKVALTYNEFAIYYQKIVDKSGQCVAYEALLRWKSSQYGFISPGEFISIAEQNGQIYDIGLWVIHKVCEQLCEWQKIDIYRHCAISVNVSSIQLIRPSFIDDIKCIFKKTKAPLHNLKFEITENVFLENLDLTVNTLNSIKSLGVRISLDDFGTGYSSLSYVQKLPIDELKIDMKFVKNALSNLTDRAIVEMIVNLGHMLDVKVVAEGVENKELLMFLKSIQCDLYQGYYYSKPLPIEMIDK